jgi:hypothetical protein
MKRPHEAPMKQTDTLTDDLPSLSFLPLLSTEVAFAQMYHKIPSCLSQFVGRVLTTSQYMLPT